jgi:hypothetical protein
MSTEIKASTETITLPADPEALAKAIVERFGKQELWEIANTILEAAPLPTMADVLKEMTKGRTLPPAPDPATFSEQQLKIVRALWNAAKCQKREFDSGMINPDHYWHLRPYWSGLMGDEITPSQRASVSRALRRLEDRGIVQRWAGPGGRRTVQASLTTAGKRLAERLING